MKHCNQEHYCALSFLVEKVCLSCTDGGNYYST